MARGHRADPIEAYLRPRFPALMRIAVQEYGATNPQLIAELAMNAAASVVKVPVYQWGLPIDLGNPCENSVREHPRRLHRRHPLHDRRSGHPPLPCR